MEKFIILGERCSGTNYLQNLVQENFNVQHNKLCHKHFFLHMKPQDFKGTKVIMIVRNPKDWLNSFFHTPHHVPKKNSKSWKTFLTANPWRSVKNKKDMDMNPRTGIFFSNIFQMRFYKLKYMLFLQKKLGNKHVILLKYENVMKNTNLEINKIATTFTWKTKNDVIQQIDYDATKFNNKKQFVTYKKTIYEEMPKNVHNFIQKQINWNAEKYMGYEE